jgi:hypothetical protein
MIAVIAATSAMRIHAKQVGDGRSRESNTGMSLITLGWLFTAGVLAHNTEEALLLPAWSREARTWYRPVGRPTFWFGASIFSAALVGIMVAASTAPARSIVAYALTGYALAMVLNVFVPHLALSIFTRGYVPGLVTALLCNLPLGGAFLYRAVVERYVALDTFLWAGPLTVLVMVAAIPLLFKAGGVLFRDSRAT